MASAAAGAAKAGPTVEQITEKFQEMQEMVRQVNSKIGEQEMELKEYSLVEETLQGADPERKCFRLIGGVLVERTVKEVLPALTEQKKTIALVIDKLKETLETKTKELAAFQKEFGIRPRGQASAGSSGEGGEGSGNTGVLV